MDEKPLISVVVITYNHEQYILDALKGIASQETSFPFEVIIHDDASTDETRRLIEKFVKCNEISVKTVFQESNIYSQGDSYIEYVDPLVEGKYVALCEGDDFWTDPAKLQRQYDYMEGHPNCSAVVHDADIFDASRNRVIGRVVGRDKEMDFSLDYIIRSGGGLFPTCSLLCRRELFEFPAEFCGWGIGDYPRSIWLAENGDIHYLPRVISIYRFGTPGSWTMRVSSPDQAKKELAIRIEKLQALNELRYGSNSDAISYAISRTCFFTYIGIGDWRDAACGPGKIYFRDLSQSDKTKYWLKTHFPNVFRFMKSLVK